jgi:hypothetical protein
VDKSLAKSDAPSKESRDTKTGRQLVFSGLRLEGESAYQIEPSDVDKTQEKMIKR